MEATTSEKPGVTSRSGAWTAPASRIVLALLIATGLLTLVGVAGNTPRLEIGSVSSNSLGDDPTNASSRFEEFRELEAPAPAPVTEPAEPIEIPRFVLYVFGAIAACAALYFLSLQTIRFRVRRPAVHVTTAESTIDEAEHAEEVVKFARDLIDELSDGDDPRAAIQQAYAAVETGFGAAELERKPAETPLKYLERALGRNSDVAESLAVLTELFEVARFSPHPIDEPTRVRAIAALSEVRDSYQRHAPARRR